VVCTPVDRSGCGLASGACRLSNGPVEPITVLLVDDNLIVREGVRALLAGDPQIQVVGVAGSYDEMVAAADELTPQVIVTDIRMPPDFLEEGIAGAKEVRRRLPGTGVVVLSQYDSPEYALHLLADGATGYAYLLKDRVADSDRLGRAVREVATGGSMLDPEIVAAVVSPARDGSALSTEDEALLQEVVQGRPLKVMAAARRTTPEAVNGAIEHLFLALARGASAGEEEALRRLRTLHAAILDREEVEQTLSRLLPGGLAEHLRADRGAVDRTERLTVTVLMSDVRGYSTIAEHSDPARLAAQLNAHRQAMNAAILGRGGTVMQYVGDAVMAVFGAPIPATDHAACAVLAAVDMHRRQGEVDREWQQDGLAPFGLGIGLSTGEVAAALLGSQERVEYTLVGDTVNISSRLQDLARPAGTTVASEKTVQGAGSVDCRWEALGPQHVKGRETPLLAYRLLMAPPSEHGTDEQVPR
jgi:adenylate cyclase